MLLEELRGKKASLAECPIGLLLHTIRPVGWNGDNRQETLDSRGLRYVGYVLGGTKWPETRLGKKGLYCSFLDFIFGYRLSWEVSI